MLLEEALTPGPTSRSLPPQEVCQALLSFLRDELPAGGLAAEQRFVHLFPLVMDRVFGRLLPTVENAQSPSSVGAAGQPSSSAPLYQHAPNGWMSLLQNPITTNYSIDNDPLVKLLRAPLCLSLFRDGSSSRRGGNGGIPTLLDAMSADSAKGIHVDYPLNCLEQRVVDCVKELICPQNTPSGIGMPASALKTSSYTPKKNGDEAKTKLTRRGEDNISNLLDLFPEQKELRVFFQQHPLTPGKAIGGKSPFSPQPAALSPFGKSFGGSPRSSPVTIQHSQQGLKSPTKEKEPRLQLTMMEYYFIIFVRFPLLVQPPPQGRPMVRYSGNYGASLYSYLLATYLKYYLPSGKEPLHPHSELVLRLLMEFWLRHNLVATTEEAVKSFTMARGGPPALRDAVDLSRVENKFRTLPSLIQNGIMSAVRHLVGDLSLREGVQKVSGCIQERQVKEREGVQDEVERMWCLPPAITLIQPALLNYVRVGLACGSIHHKDSSFHKALEVWLLWLEPWNFLVKKRMVHGRNGGSGPRDLLRAAAANVAHPNVECYSHYAKPGPTSKSTYSPQWEAYVVANIHFYVVPLAIFLRRARELEFSSAAEFPKSLALVQRVLRCYPKAIVTILNGVLNSRADAVTTGIASRHVEVLGPYAPPEDWKLQSCQVDAMNLLEEMFGQYQKRVRNMNFIERWEANMEALFSGSMRSEEGNLQSVLGQLKSLVGLPLEYQVPVEMAHARSRGLFSFVGNASAGARVDSFGPDRDSDGLLTDLGRHQLSTGERKCSPFDVKYLGDPMLKPYQSYEVPALVDLAIFLSNYLNDKLGFVPSSSLADDADKDEDLFSKNIREMQRYNKITFRLNLRFLADYRNVLRISVAAWVLRKLF